MKRITGLLLCSVLISGTAVLTACPFCDAPSLTLAEQIDQAGHLLLGRWKGGEKPTNESAGTAAFEIVSIGKSKGDAFHVGETIELPQYIAGDEKALYILMGPETRLIDWQVPVEATESSWDYISRMPMPKTEETEKIERLAYFIDYLQHPELIVSNDAYAEFASAPYEIITPLKDRFPREKLRQWVMDADTPVTRMGLYGLLLGLCGQEEDAVAMKDKILHPDADFRLGIEGVMSGYLLITGEEGLRVLEESKMMSRTYVDKDGNEKKLPFSETYAAMQTLRFMWTYEPDRLPKERLKESMRTLLSRPELADLVIADLARWKDWGVQDRLMEMYDQEEFDIPSIKRAVVRYLIYCNKDVEEGSEDLPEYAVTAAKHLEVLEEKDPKTVRDARRFLIR
ncbi:MAG: hypothetical protein KDA81_06200 [Planctomycetaceae bacterium]|nr:hypothetical protein [Planctomycetaceae bacterium]